MKVNSILFAVIAIVIASGADGATYGRGAGRSPCTGCSGCSGCGWGGCSGCSGCSSCSTSHCRDNEDVNGALCYPKCRAGYSAVGCCLCSGSPPPPPTNKPTKAPTFNTALFRRNVQCKLRFKLSDSKSAAQCIVDATKNSQCGGMVMFAEDQTHWGCYCCRQGSELEAHTWWSVYTHATKNPTKAPTRLPTGDPTPSPTKTPTDIPTSDPTTPSPTKAPTDIPTSVPTTLSPTMRPTLMATKLPTGDPTTPIPTSDPTREPTITSAGLLEKQPSMNTPSQTKVPIFIGVGAGCAVIGTVIIGAIIMQARTSRKSSSLEEDESKDEVTFDVYGGRVMFKNPTFSHSNESLKD